MNGGLFVHFRPSGAGLAIRGVSQAVKQRLSGGGIEEVNLRSIQHDLDVLTRFDIRIGVTLISS